MHIRMDSLQLFKANAPKAVFTAACRGHIDPSCSKMKPVLHQCVPGFAPFPVHEGLICLKSPTDVCLQLGGFSAGFLQKETHPVRGTRTGKPPTNGKILLSPCGRGPFGEKGAPNKWPI